MPAVAIAGAAQGANSVTIQAYDSSGGASDFDFYHVVAYA